MNYAIFDSLLDAVLVIDESSNLLYGNQAASQLFDVSQRRLAAQKPVLDLIQFAEPEGFQPEFLKQILAATPYKEMSFICKSGKDGWGQVSIQPNEVDGQIQYVIYIRDVTLEQSLQRKYRAELEQKEHVILDLRKAQAELENYSKNLEKMVAERTRELSHANALLNAILNSLGQGFLVFDREGCCLSVYSRICQSILETVPEGQMIEQVLRVPERELNDFKTWRTTLFEEPIPFEDLVPLGPRTFAHSREWMVELEFYPMRDEQKKVDGVVVVASNKTAEHKARKEAERERQLVMMILKIVKAKRQFVAFIHEAQKLIADLQEAIQKPQLDVHALAYHLHTLKGGAGSFSVQDLQGLAHTCEDVLAEWGRAPHNSAEQNQQRQRLSELIANLRLAMDTFLSQYGVLVGTNLEAGPRRVEVPMSDLLECAELLPVAQREQLREWTREPLMVAFEHYRDLVQDLAISQNKQLAPLTIEGGELRVFPEYYQEVFGNLVHVFRNAVDHGLETPDERQSHGKEPAAQMRVQCALSGDRKRLQLQIIDDGRGISPEIIRSKLLERGVAVADESDEMVIQHIFDDSFSTKTEVTALSGRGVGLAAVKQAVEHLGGRIEVQSQPGVGTTFRIEMPFFHEPPPLAAVRAAA
jgi:two-component system chemotaxis sensor kinase CheA